MCCGPCAVSASSSVICGSGRRVRILELTNTDPVERVRGASLKVRVLWNPDIFSLTGNGLDNFRRFTDWSAQWRKIETETFELGGLR